MQHQNPEDLFALGCALARRIKRIALLHSSWARGYVVAAVDGIEICGSYPRCCPRCLERRVKRNVEGELRECLQYYHRIVVMAVVSGPFPVPLGLRFQQPGEGEVACARLLLRELGERLGRRYFDLLVADAIYPAAERMTAGPAHGTETGANQSLDFWHLPELCWPVAHRTVRILKTVRRSRRSLLAVTDKSIPARRQRQSSEEAAANFCASNLALGAIPPLFLHQLGRCRWVIDSQVFQTLTTDCHLKKPSAHQSQTLVVLTMIRLLAYTLSLLFYHRQVFSHASPATPASFAELAAAWRHAPRPLLSGLSTAAASGFLPRTSDPLRATCAYPRPRAGKPPVWPLLSSPFASP